MKSMEQFDSPPVRPFGGPRWAEVAALLAELGEDPANVVDIEWHSHQPDHLTVVHADIDPATGQHRRTVKRPRLHVTTARRLWD